MIPDECIGVSDVLLIECKGETPLEVKSGKKRASSNNPGAIAYEHLPGLHWNAPSNNITLNEICSTVLTFAETLKKWIDTERIASSVSLAKIASCLNSFDECFAYLIDYYHPVFCLANDLEGNPRKMRLTNREEFSKCDHYLKPANPGEPCDKNLLKFARLLQCNMNCLLAVILTYCVYIADMHASEDVSVKAMNILTRAWDIADRCSPRGIRSLERNVNGETVLDKSNCVQHLSFSPLADFFWIGKSGFTKLQNVQENDPESTPPHIVKAAFRTATADISLARLNRFNLQACTVIDLHLKAAKYLQSHKSLFAVPVSFPLYNSLKSLTNVSLNLKLPPLDDGWLHRALDLGPPTLKIATLQFLLKTFAHDYSSIESQKKLDLPTQHMVWQTAPAVRKIVVDTLIVLSHQLPYKDGAFKKFIPLLSSPYPAFRRTGIKLFTKCRTINLSALSLAIRMLISHAISPKAGSLDQWIEAAINLANTNAPYMKGDCLKAIQEFWTRSFDPSRPGINESSDEKSYSRAFLIYSAFALKVLDYYHSSMLSIVPMPVLENYQRLQRMFPEYYSLRFYVICPSTQPLALKFDAACKVNRNIGFLEQMPSSRSVVSTPTALRTEDSIVSPSSVEENNITDAAISVGESMGPSQTQHVADLHTEHLEPETVEIISDRSDGEISEDIPDEPNLSAASSLPVENDDNQTDEGGPAAETYSVLTPLSGYQTSISHELRKTSAVFVEQWSDLTDLCAQFVPLPTSEPDVLQLPLADPESTVEKEPSCMIVCRNVAVEKPKKRKLSIYSPFSDTQLVELEPGVWKYAFMSTDKANSFYLEIRNAKFKGVVVDAQERVLTKLAKKRTEIPLSTLQPGWHTITIKQSYGDV